MNLREILTIMQNRLLTLNEARKSAVNAGLLEQVISIDSSIESTEITIAQLTAALAL